VPSVYSRPDRRAINRLA